MPRIPKQSFPKLQITEAGRRNIPVHKFVFLRVFDGLTPGQDYVVVTRIKETGTTILLVEQNAQAALSIADRAYVLETGKIVKTGRGSDLISDPDIKKAYLGA